MNRFAKLFAALIAILPLVSGHAMAESQNDPFEGYNRAMFSFNEGFDDYVYRPVAKGYATVVPEPARDGITNFFGNIRDIWYSANHFMQGKGERGVKDLARVTANTIFGIGGLIDVATKLGIEKEEADFGQTLGVWGVGSGPYVVLPILGDSTVRDTIALPAEWYGDPWSYVRKIRVRNIGVVLRAINYRANLLDASDFVDEVALDKYEFRRDAYLQRRQAMIEGRVAAAWETQTSDPFINPASNALPKTPDKAPEAVPVDAAAPSIPVTESPVESKGDSSVKEPVK